MVELLRWVERTRGPSELLVIHQRVAPPWRQELDPSRSVLGFRVGGWYAAGLVHAVYDAMVADLPPGQRPILARKAGLAVGERICPASTGSSSAPSSAPSGSSPTCRARGDRTGPTVR